MDLFSAAAVPLAVEDSSQAISRLLDLVDGLSLQKREQLTKLRFDQGVETWQDSAYNAREAVYAGVGEETWFAGVEQVKAKAKQSREGLWTGPWDAAMSGVTAIMARPYIGQVFTYKDYSILCEPLRGIGLRVHPED